MRSKIKSSLSKLHNKRRRKRRHARQIESRLRNEYNEYLNKMNDFEYTTWLSEVTNEEEEDHIYNKQVSNKEKLLKEINSLENSLPDCDSSCYNDSTIIDSYDIVDKLDNNNKQKDQQCIIA